MAITWGDDSLAPPLEPARFRHPRDAIDEIVTDALTRAPCLVAFSGGRDSSVLLAVAADVARRRGLPAPIPITNVFPAHAESDENDWQQEVIAHLGIEDWVRLSWTNELDMIGEFGSRVLLRHGVMVPHNAHFLEPMLEEANGGTLMTGAGGDELFGRPWRPLAADLMNRHRLPPRRKLPRLLVELSPIPIRTRVEARRLPIVEFSWIRERPRNRIALDYARSHASVPLSWDRALGHWWRARRTQCIRSTMSSLGSAHDVEIVNPFYEPGLMSACARAFGARGPGGRTDALSVIWGSLLPERILKRSSKAAFDSVFWGQGSRDFVAGWSGGGIDPELVDVEELAMEWSRPNPAVNTYALLQHAWLDSQPSTRGEALL